MEEAIKKLQKVQLRNQVNAVLQTLETRPKVLQIKNERILDQLKLFMQLQKLPPNSCFGLYDPGVCETPLATTLKGLYPDFQHAYPRPNLLNPKEMDYYLGLPTESCKKWGNFIKVPDPQSPMIIPHIIFTPALAYDFFGNRLGHGKGFFDRYMARVATLNEKLQTKPPVFVGICYEEQFFHQIPTEGHDFSVQYVISEKFHMEILPNSSSKEK